MSLRWRVALALALLAGLATSATALIAYASTRDQLAFEVDRSLARGSEMAVHAGRLGPLSDGAGRAFLPPALASNLVRYHVQIQTLAADGAVLTRVGDVALPVAPADVLIANTGAPARYRTVTVDEASYRVLTVPLPEGGAAQFGRDVTEIGRALAALRLRFLAIGTGVVAAAAACGALFARRTTAPLEQLTRTAEDVAATGDLETAITPTGTDEAGRLARAFSTMLDALARSRAQQQQLVQDAGHELRTPLTSVRTNIDVLARHPDLPTGQREALLEDLRTEVGELAGLLDELVQLATDHHDDELVAPLELDALVERVTARAARRHEREYRISGQGAVVAGRAGALERAISNLCDNAAKFSPAGSPVDVDLDRGRVSVHDRGRGIDAVDLPRVFDRFYRPPASHALPGAGLGLAIVRQVVESHDGTVFAGNHPDGGALVGFELPVSGNGTA